VAAHQISQHLHSFSVLLQSLHGYLSLSLSLFLALSLSLSLIISLSLSISSCVLICALSVWLGKDSHRNHLVRVIINEFLLLLMCFVYWCSHVHTYTSQLDSVDLTASVKALSVLCLLRKMLFDRSKYLQSLVSVPRTASLFLSHMQTTDNKQRQPFSSKKKRGGDKSGSSKERGRTTTKGDKERDHINTINNARLLTSVKVNGTMKLEFVAVTQDRRSLADNERKANQVCVCVCVCERESREREGKREGIQCHVIYPYILVFVCHATLVYLYG